MVPEGCRKRVPASGSIIPAASLSRVDFPDPLRPTRHKRSEGPIESSAPSSRGVPPKVRWMSLRKRSGGAMARLRDPNDLRLHPRLSRLLVATAALSRRARGRAVEVVIGQRHEDQYAEHRRVETESSLLSVPGLRLPHGEPFAGNHHEAEEPDKKGERGADDDERLGLVEHRA